MKINQIVLFLLGVCACSADLVDRQCGNDLSNLWLDIVAVVDNSIGMTRDGLDSIKANLVSVLGQSQIGTDPSNPRTTRVAIVTYSANDTINADLNAFQSIDDLLKGLFANISEPSNTITSYLATGLEGAEQLFSSQSDNTARAHYPRAVIVYASTYEGSDKLDPLPVAERLKSHGVNIITVAYNQDGDEALLGKLSNIATPHFSFSNTDGNSVQQVQDALVQTNCFCPSNWESYRESHDDIYSHRYGVCLQAVNLKSAWTPAQYSCRDRLQTSGNRKTSHLATEYNQAKHDFIFAMVQNATGFSSPYIYHIGLTYQNIKGQGMSWVWDEPQGFTNPQLQEQDWLNWNDGYPSQASQKSGSLNKQKGLGTLWQNVGFYDTSANYICEATACDTDNYCAAPSS